jgi:hypothetical protein
MEINITQILHSASRPSVATFGKHAATILHREMFSELLRTMGEQNLELQSRFVDGN